MHILLDLDNVLLNTFEVLPNGKHFFYWSETIEKDLGIKPIALQETFLADSLLKDKEELKETTIEIFKRHAPHLKYDDFIKYWKEKDANLDNDMWQWVKEASKRHTFHIASNQNVERMEFLLDQFLQWNEVFNEVFFPYPLQAYKPQKEFFIRALEKLGADPKDVLFIDDDENNINTAKELGLQTILFKSIDDVKGL